MEIFKQIRGNKEKDVNALCFNAKFNTNQQAGENVKEINTLNSLKINSKATIIGYDKSIDIKTKRRMLELGFVNGKTIMLGSKSFLGDVLLIEINGYLLSLRADIAKHILIKQILNRGNV